MTTLKSQALSLSAVSLLCAALFNQFSGRGIAWVRSATTPSSAANTTTTQDLAQPPVSFNAGNQTPAQVRPRVLSLAQAHEFHLQQKAHFIDAREPERFAAGHVSGARNLPLYLPQNWPPVLQKISRAQSIITYCDEDCDSARRLALVLIDSGYVQVYVLDGGYDSWRNAGYAVEEAP